MPHSFSYEAFAGAFLAKELQDLRLVISEQCDAIFEAFNIAAPSHCASAVLALAAEGPIGLLDLAEHLGCSHQLADQKVRLLERLSLARRKACARDRRKNLILLTKKGEETAVCIERALPLIAQAIDSLNVEIGANLRELAAVARAALLRAPLTERAEFPKPRRSAAKRRAP